MHLKSYILLALALLATSLHATGKKSGAQKSGTEQLKELNAYKLPPKNLYETQEFMTRASAGKKDAATGKGGSPSKGKKPKPSPVALLPQEDPVVTEGGNIPPPPPLFGAIPPPPMNPPPKIPVGAIHASSESGPMPGESKTPPRASKPVSEGVGAIDMAASAQNKIKGRQGVLNYSDDEGSVMSGISGIDNSMMSRVRDGREKEYDGKGAKSIIDDLQQQAKKGKGTSSKKPVPKKPLKVKTLNPEGGNLQDQIKSRPQLKKVGAGGGEKRGEKEEGGVGAALKGQFGKMLVDSGSSIGTESSGEWGLSSSEGS